MAAPRFGLYMHASWQLFDATGKEMLTLYSALPEWLV